MNELLDVDVDVIGEMQKQRAARSAERERELADIEKEVYNSKKSGAPYSSTIRKLLEQQVDWRAL